MKVLAFQILHNEVLDALVLPEFVDGDDVLVMEIARRGGFISKPANVADLGVRFEHFDGYNPAHLGIKSAEDFANTAPPNLSLKLESADSSGGGVLCWSHAYAKAQYRQHYSELLSSFD